MAEPIKTLVRQAGGTVEGDAWIKYTIKARVPACAIAELKEINGVVAIDLPLVSSSASNLQSN